MRLRPRVCKAARRTLLSLGLLAALSGVGGCQDARRGIRVQDAPDLERRAIDLLLRAAENDDPVVCSNAIEALTKVAPDEGLPRFRAALRSSEPLVRFAGLVALGTVRDKTARALLRVQLSDPHALVRLGAAYAVCRLGETDAGRMLVSAMSEHPDERVRLEAAHLIGLLGEKKAVRRLRAALQVRANEKSSLVRIEIYAALARLGDDEGLRRLLEHAQGDALARLTALQALADLGDPKARDVLLYHLDAREDYPLHRLIAARGLARLGAREGFELALKSAQYVGTDPQDPEETFRIRLNAALALGEYRDPRALGALRQMAEKALDPRIQTAACYAICRILRQ